MSTEQTAPTSHPQRWRRAWAIVLLGLLLVSVGFAISQVVGNEGGIISGEEWLLGHSYMMAAWGAVLWIALLLWGNVNIRAALLFCLSLPGAIVLPLLAITFFADFGQLGPFLLYMIFILYPGAFILPLVAAVQAPRLRMVQAPGASGGYLCAAGIVSLYLWTSYAQNASI